MGMPQIEIEPFLSVSRRRFVLEDTGFDEVPKKYRHLYRRWQGAHDVLAPNEALCPVCKVVMRSRQELRVGDRLFCMTCMMRYEVVSGPKGGLEVRAIY